MLNNAIDNNKQKELNTSDNGLIDLGCFGDSENGPAISSLEGSNPVTDVHWTAREDPVAVCKLAAESKS